MGKVVFTCQLPKLVGLKGYFLLMLAEYPELGDAPLQSSLVTHPTKTLKTKLGCLTKQVLQQPMHLTTWSTVCC